MEGESPLNKWRRSGGVHIAGREGAACPDAFCRADDYHVAEDDTTAGLDLSPTRWVFTIKMWVKKLFF